jgi:hypothetical protein
VYLHELPIGGIICSRVRKEHSFYPVKAEYINETAKKFFLKCDGTLQSHQIIRNICQEAGEKNDKGILSKVLGFFDYCPKERSYRIIKQALASKTKSRRLVSLLFPSPSRYRINLQMQFPM